jgi:hypothetical protein
MGDPENEKPAAKSSSGRVQRLMKLIMLEFSGRFQQRLQAASTIERNQVIAATHMGLADENLRHRASARDSHHVIALGRVAVYAYLFDLLDPFGLQDLFGPNAIGADSGGVHLDA